MIDVLVGKELRVDAGSLRMGKLRSVLLGCILLGLLFGMGRFPLQSGDHSAIPRYGRAMFSFIAWTLCVGGLLLGPILAVGSISGERRRGTLGILSLAGFTATQIVCGKFAARLAASAMSILSTLPIVLFVNAYGGVSHAEIVAVYATALTAAAWGCALGVALSVVTEEGPGATMIALGIIALVFGLPFAVARAGPAAGMSFWSGPLTSLHGILSLGLLGEDALRPDAPWVLGNLVLLGLGGAVLSIGWMLVARPGGRPAILGPWFDRAAARLDRLAPPFIPGSDQILDAPDADDAINPFAWREAYGRSRLGLRAVAGLVVVVLAVQIAAYFFLGALRDEPAFHLVVVATLAGAAVLMVTALAGASIAGEKEDKSLETLALLEVLPHRYVFGKFSGLFALGLILSVPALLHATLFWLAGRLSILAPITVAVSVPAMAACGIAHGLYCSLRFRTVARAVAAAILTQCLFHAGQGLAGMFCCLLHLLNPLFLLILSVSLPPDSGWRPWEWLASAAGVGIAIYAIYRANLYYVHWVLWQVANQFQQRVSEHLEGEARLDG